MLYGVVIVAVFNEELAFLGFTSFAACRARFRSVALPIIVRKDVW